MIKLPAPVYDIGVDLNQALQTRRSVREYKNEALSLAHAGQLLWAAQGTTSVGGYRTAPSAGALYPLEVYLVVGRVEGLAPGVYRYDPRQHVLKKVAEGDKRAALGTASLGQAWMGQAAAMIAMTAVPERTTKRYGERGGRYVYMEAGHAAQNVLLEGVALGLGAVVVGAFSDGDVKKILELPAEEQPLYLIPVGGK